MSNSCVHDMKPQVLLTFATMCRCLKRVSLQSCVNIRWSDVVSMCSRCPALRSLDYQPHHSDHRDHMDAASVLDLVPVCDCLEELTTTGTHIFSSASRPRSLRPWLQVHQGGARLERAIDRTCSQGLATCARTASAAYLHPRHYVSAPRAELGASRAAAASDQWVDRGATRHYRMLTCARAPHREAPAPSRDVSI